MIWPAISRFPGWRSPGGRSAGWRSTSQILVAFLVAGAAVWFSPRLLEPLGLGEFAVVAQVCAGFLALSVLEVLFRRLS